MADECAALTGPSMEWTTTALRELVGTTVVLVQQDHDIRVHAEVSGVGVGVGYALSDKDEEEARLRVFSDEYGDMVVHLAQDDWSRARYVTPGDDFPGDELIQVEWPTTAQSCRPGLAPPRGRRSSLASP